MSGQFVVYADGSPVATVLFDGNRDEVYAWLMNHTALDAPGYMVLDRTNSTIQEEGDFVREYRGEVEAHKSREFLTEEDVRKIVREELKSFMGSFLKAAESRSEATTDMQFVAHDAIESVARTVDYYLPHTADCEKRTKNWNAKCTCGVMKG